MTSSNSIRRRSALCLALACALITAGASASAADIFQASRSESSCPGRLVAAAMTDRLKSPVIVENRPGATGTIGSTFVAKSPPDGYTLMFGAADTQSIMPHLVKNLPYDGRKGFTAVAPIGFFPYALAVHPSVPANSAQEFVQLARTAREPVTYGSWNVGSSGQVLAESVKAAAGINMLHVPFQGTAPLMTALIGGQIKAAILPIPLVEQYAKAGTIRLLAVATQERLAGFPAVATLREQGLHVDLNTRVGIMAPARLPPDVLERLHRAVSEAVSSPAVAERLRQLQVAPQPLGQAEYQAFIDSEFGRWGRVIQQANITLQ